MTLIQTKQNLMDYFPWQLLVSLGFCVLKVDMIDQAYKLDRMNGMNINVSTLVTHFTSLFAQKRISPFH